VGERDEGVAFLCVGRSAAADRGGIVSRADGGREAGSCRSERVENISKHAVEAMADDVTPVRC
jgi:hypothetical protein